ncbi:AraC-type DNA-binding protein [Chitinophaga eiseniae]|uniref:AraC-type DNA-binding protein n=1 Tax=Chitinophaga eiseniae TaxID=634771 RepID=A0A1T4NKX7_9BACT|nr:helix-turn-helix domain-containing protein [Chitinophaga eiseniae]SJZ79941.1 AraC-type DNA-binding protein [Chitinophaga eiseniae]
MKGEEQFPVLGISAFQGDQQDASNFLYHEIRGERRIEKPHKHDFFVFLLVESGNGIHAIDFIDYPVAPYQIHLLFPGQVHKWEFNRQMVAYQLMITRPFFETFSDALQFPFALYQHHPVIDLAEESFRKLLYEFRSIQQELAQTPVSWEIVHLRSRLIAQLIIREAESRFDDLLVYKARPALQQYHALIDLHYKNQKSVAFYASQLNISPNYLNILCKRHLHIPAMFLIQHRVVLEAKRQLQASGKSIKEIAFDLGFNDLSYFSNFFKSQTGISPRLFREQL